ncbi:signal transduction protein [Geobacillus thermoleovorans]|uniref:signal transduction protein n=1 Tax=Geobacillus thermoleovorans TaxID=33941 RepID=UPI00083B9765|nr:signal transduction protein [Geobacillus thermoleovorans]ODA18238.1 signal transduction protein [Geobacillus thermoleovorans]
MADIHRNRTYEATVWEDRVLDEATGQVIVEGTPVDEENMNNIEAGILVAHYDIGLLAAFLSQQAMLNAKELEKYKKQRLVQGQATITGSSSNGYFRDSEPFVQVSLTGFAQINAPNYDVIVTPISGDAGLAGRLEVYDKTQNGFKVRMTGSAQSVTFLWTLINPAV